MKYDEFMKRIIMYYGHYPNHGENYLMNSVYSFVKKNYREYQLETLLEVTKKTFSTEYKTQPDIKVFNKLISVIDNMRLISNPFAKLEDHTMKISDEERRANLELLRGLEKKLAKKLLNETKTSKGAV